MKSTIAAIDFGTSKIVTLISETSGNQRCDIIGAGIAAYDGYIDGEWNNPVVLNDAILQSVTEAESQARRKLKEINVGVPGEFTRVYVVETSVTIQGADPRVSPKHVEKIFADADKQLSPVRGVVVHRSPAWFMVDGGKKTLEPVGMKGSELKALVSFVVADTFFLDDVMARLRDLNITVSGFFSSCTGEAMLYLLEEDRDRTAILIDIGYTCTDVMVVEGDAVIFQKSMPIGGGHIAADIAEGLKIPLASAEQIKREYVYGVSGKNQSYSVFMGEGVKHEAFTQEDVAAVLEPRVDEISDMIKTCIEESGIKTGNWSAIFLTGGGLALNRGGRDYLSGRLGKPVRETVKRTIKLSSPIYASAMGLMDLIIDTVEARTAPSAATGGVKDFFKSLLGG
ncbi:MAG TPA: cell division FtsA domain-containing protein [Candidatus Limiplasma sp.]|nr:cell division FtsA domain-containing protein [Candidatus Limiplasma sp.]